MNYKSYTGIVLKRQPWREADEIVTFWSWEEGKVRLLVRAVRKSTSRLKGALAPLSWLKLSVVSSEYFPVVVSAQVIGSYPRLVGSLTHLAAVFNLLEMILRATADNEPNTGVTLLLRHGMDHLEAGNGVGEDFFNIYRLHLLSALGYRLTLEVCANCHSPFSESQQEKYFSNLAFGALCPACVRVSSDAWKLDGGVCRYLLALNKQPVEFCTRQFEAETRNSSGKLLNDFFRFVIERPLNSQKFLDQTLAAKN